MKPLVTVTVGHRLRMRAMTRRAWESARGTRACALSDASLAVPCFLTTSARLARRARAVRAPTAGDKLVLTALLGLILTAVTAATRAFCLPVAHGDTHVILGPATC
jgi:hypothetical protein